ncbi:sulfotransferase family 2 domain-containing protein [Limimaricola sp. G21655-S1]|uniref:sulfotransferase family 2 domain-containing protein n=1 Tax=Limimaricola sp. G21655-S1 TaxID=3014768 RepID=UPI0022AF5542|nr:sulfotransferase family 2 domain-containing protein [Limimaricola sp. G21655-S1]
MPIFQVRGLRILFVHIPKTGGSSVSRWLGEAGAEAFRIPTRTALPCPPQHFHAELLGALFPGSGWFDYAFAITRHPEARMISEYVWRKSGGRKLRRWGGLRRLAVAEVSPETRGRDFSRWLRQNLRAAEQNPYHLSNHLRSQVEFTDLPGLEIFRFEDGMEPVFARLSEVTGLAAPHDLPREKATGGLEVPLQAGDRARIETRYAMDYDRFDYGRGGAGGD